MENITTVGELVSYLIETHDPADPWIVTLDGAIRSSRGRLCPVEAASVRRFGYLANGQVWSVIGARKLGIPKDVEIEIALAADNYKGANAEIRNLLLSLCAL